MAYTDSMLHRLTIAAIYTPSGEQIRSETHDEHCTFPACVAKREVAAS